MSQRDGRTVVEIHVPLAAELDEAGEDPNAWLDGDQVEGFLFDLEEQGELEVYDAGEESDGVYVFAITGDDEETLLAVASRVARLPQLPDGVFAVVTDETAEEYGAGRRVELPAG